MRREMNWTSHHNERYDTTLYEEVAAILEYDGGYPRKVAETLADVRVYSMPEIPYTLLMRCNQRLVARKSQFALDEVPDAIILHSKIGVTHSNKFYVPLFDEKGKCVRYDQRSHQSIHKYLSDLAQAEKKVLELVAKSLNSSIGI